MLYELQIGLITGRTENDIIRYAVAAFSKLRKITDLLPALKGGGS